MYCPKRREVYETIKLINNSKINKLLSSTDPARVFSILRFYELFKNLPNFSFKEFINIAVISGSDKEPELFFFDNAKLDTLCFDENLKPGSFQFWDLNLDWSEIQYSDFHNKYDLVLCEQVFEHIPCPENAMRNIKVILKKRGLAHISVPTINGVHTEPYYFTAGYHSRMLNYLSNKIGGFKVIECDSWGTKKAAKMYAVCDWTSLVSSGDLIDCIYISSKFFKIKRVIKFFYHKFKYNFESIWNYREKNFPVISWILLQKK